jgi:hypothetical protein
VRYKGALQKRRLKGAYPALRTDHDVRTLKGALQTLLGFGVWDLGFLLKGALQEKTVLEKIIFNSV